MKMYIKIVLIFTLGILLTNCNGDDGIDGMAGEDGRNGTEGVAGTDGTNGTNGLNGSDGLGFDALLAYGSVSSTISGTRVDGVPFIDETEFIFLPIGATDFASSSRVTFDGEDLKFTIERHAVVPDDYYGYDTVEISFNVIDAGLPTQSFAAIIEFDSHLILGEDLNYFLFEEVFDHEDVTNFSITDYSFNEETYELKFSYTFDVSGEENDTENHVTISGNVDVIVFEDISPDYDEVFEGEDL